MGDVYDADTAQNITVDGHRLAEQIEHEADVCHTNPQETTRVLRAGYDAVRAINTVLRRVDRRLETEHPGPWTR